MKHFLIMLVVALFCFSCTAKTHYVEPAKNGTGCVLFLRMPEAKQVEIAASPFGFAPRPAINTGDGLWEFRIGVNKPFEYFYIVDGKTYTPPCRLSRPDGFGGYTCIYDPGR